MPPIGAYFKEKNGYYRVYTIKNNNRLRDLGKIKPGAAQEKEKKMDNQHLVYLLMAAMLAQNLPLIFFGFAFTSRLAKIEAQVSILLICWQQGKRIGPAEESGGGLANPW